MVGGEREGGGREERGGGFITRRTCVPAGTADKLIRQNCSAAGTEEMNVFPLPWRPGKRAEPWSGSTDYLQGEERGWGERMMKERGVGM